MNDTAIRKDRYMKGHVFRQLKLSSLMECAAKCIMSSACKSFNFDPEASICQLNSNSSDNAEVLPKTGHLYSDIVLWPKNIGGPCATQQCPVDHACDVDRQGRTICKQEFIGCDVPPNVSNSEVSCDGHFLHAEAVYTCVQDFRSCGSSATWRLRCEASGKWEGLSSTCERYRWTEQEIVFNKPIPCGPTDKVQVKWTGTPLKDSRFRNYFSTGSDWPFFVDIRFKYGPGRMYLEINTLKDGHYGKEERIFRFPFRIHRAFLIEMALLQGQYVLKANGTRLVTFPERLAGMKPDKVGIDGDVTIHSVEIHV